MRHHFPNWLRQLVPASEINTSRQTNLFCTHRNALGLVLRLSLKRANVTSRVSLALGAASEHMYMRQVKTETGLQATCRHPDISLYIWIA